MLIELLAIGSSSLALLAVVLIVAARMEPDARRSRETRED